MVKNREKIFEKVIKKELGKGAEFFYDVQCPDPRDADKAFTFWLVGIHSEGIHLVWVVDDSEGTDWVSTERMEYVCSVFKDYFHTSMSVRSLYVVRNYSDAPCGDVFGIYDCCLKSFRTLLLGFVPVSERDTRNARQCEV